MTGYGLHMACGSMMVHERKVGTQVDGELGVLGMLHMVYLCREKTSS